MTYFISTTSQVQPWRKEDIENVTTNVSLVMLVEISAFISLINGINILLKNLPNQSLLSGAECNRNNGTDTKQ